MTTTHEALSGREYLRVSLDRSGTGKSPDQQHDENERGFPGTLGEPYREPGSASASRFARKAREVFSRLLADLEAGEFGADVLVLWESSRGSRTVREWVSLVDLCEAQHVGIFVTTHGRQYDPANPRDRRMLLEDAVDSEYESAKISLRNKRSTSANAATGRPHGRILYGYRREYDPQTRAFLAQVESSPQAEIVREAARRIVAGDSCYGIARDFNDRQIPIPHKPSNPRNFPEWNGAQIKRMVTNPGYIGKRVHQGQVIGDALWPALLDDQTFYSASRILNDPARKQTRDGAVRFLLTGIATCGKCGRILKTGRQNNGAKTRYRTYQCKEFHTSRRQELLDEFIAALAVERLRRPDLLSVLAQDSSESSSALGELSEKRLRLQEIESEISAGGRSVAILSRSADSLLAEIETLENRVKRATVSPVVGEMMGEDAQQKWEDADLNRKREVLRALFSEISIHPVPDELRGQRGFNKRLVSWEFVGTEPQEETPNRRTVKIPARLTEESETLRRAADQTFVRLAVDKAPAVPQEQADTIRRALDK